LGTVLSLEKLPVLCKIAAGENRPQEVTKKLSKKLIVV
jgi:hypothetical protein